MEDFELTLFDRIEVIKTTNKKYDLENNAYLSFSGGKDSTVLHYLLDLALPNNNIQRVYADTGIEYNDVRNFVFELAKNDKRFKIIRPSKSIKETLERVGYPFKSKEHSLKVNLFNKLGYKEYIKRYIYKAEINNTGKYACPKILLYQFETQGKYNYSNKCCNEFKKKPFALYQKQENKQITITGMRREEGGMRESKLYYY